MITSCSHHTGAGNILCIVHCRNTLKNVAVSLGMLSFFKMIYKIYNIVYLVTTVIHVNVSVEVKL
jgi:hypothetical protein